MIRTQIQLPREEYEKLRKVAARLRKSMAACIRDGIQLFLRHSQASEADLTDLAGKFRPLRMKDLKPHDRWRAEAALGLKSAGRKR